MRGLDDAVARNSRLSSADDRVWTRTVASTPAAPDVVARAGALAAACERHGVPVRAAAMQFPLAHPAVAGLVAGVRTQAHLDEYPVLLRRPIPAALWDELRSSGLIHPEAPVPA